MDKPYKHGTQLGLDDNGFLLNNPFANEPSVVKLLEGLYSDAAEYEANSSTSTSSTASIPPGITLSPCPWSLATTDTPARATSIANAQKSFLSSLYANDPHPAGSTSFPSWNLTGPAGSPSTTSTKTTTHTTLSTKTTTTTTKTTPAYPTNTAVDVGGAYCFGPDQGNYVDFTQSQGQDVVKSFRSEGYVLELDNTYGQVQEVMEGGYNAVASASWAPDQTGCSTIAPFPFNDVPQACMHF
ncbi:hypothetical protein F5884DRAFT_858703 [Xylogone sp. PMI_703]|nr:hypothetical protein F5884DRAFT_858703 [Xylogone sp. PMI_703]